MGIEIGVAVGAGGNGVVAVGVGRVLLSSGAPGVALGTGVGVETGVGAKTWARN